MKKPVPTSAVERAAEEITLAYWPLLQQVMPLEATRQRVKDNIAMLIQNQLSEPPHDPA